MHTKYKGSIEMVGHPISDLSPLRVRIEKRLVSERYPNNSINQEIHTNETERRNVMSKVEQKDKEIISIADQIEMERIKKADIKAILHD